MTGKRAGADLHADDARLVELEDSVRVRYMTDPKFHAQVQVGANALLALYPDMDHREAKRAAILVLAASQVPAPPAAHVVISNHNGDPICSCSWDPIVDALPDMPFPRTQMEALTRVRIHIKNQPA